MKPATDNQIVFLLNKVSVYAATVTIVISLIIAVGWIFNLPDLRGIFGGNNYMKFNSTLSFALSGAGILFLHKIEKSDIYRAFSTAAAAIVFLIGFITFLQYVFNTNTGLDELFVNDPGIISDTNPPGRMSFNTSAGFMVTGVALFLGTEGTGKLVLYSQLLSLILIVSCFLPVLGYVYGVPEPFSHMMLTRMSLGTAILFLLTDTGLLFAFPGKGLISIITTQSMGGYLARCLLPVAVLLPVVFVWVLLIIENNTIMSITGNINSVAVLLIIVFILLIWRFLSIISLIDKSRTKAINKALTANRHLHYNVENSPLAFIEWDKWQRVKRWTKQAEEIFGWKAEEVMGKSPSEWKFIYEEDKPAIESIMRSLSGNQVARNKSSNRNYTRDGRVIDCIWYNSVIPDNEGNISSIISMVDNVTHQKEIEKRLKESEELYRSLVEITKDAIYIICRNVITFVNPAAVKLFGAENQDQITGRSPYDFFHKDYHRRMEERIKKLLKGESVPLLEKKVVRLDGSVIDVELAAISFFSRNETAILVAMRDITERKKIEYTLRRNEFILRMAGNLAHLGGWMFDVPENRVIWSDQAAEIHDMPTGYSPNSEEAVNFFAPEYQEKMNHLFNKSVNEGLPFDEEMEIITGKGRRVWIRISGKAQRDSSGRVVQVFGGVQDISEKKVSEQNLQQALWRAEESDKLKTSFLNNLSHEIRTPLNAVVGFSELLNQPGNSSERIQYLTGVILKSSDQLLDVIENIINISTIETGQTEVFETKTDINQLISQVHEKFRIKADSKGIKLRSFSSITSAQAIVFTDEGKIRNILTLLVDNAIKFTDEGHVELGCTLKDNMLQFYVQDTGIGIDPSLHDSVFERFQQVETELTRKRGGIGLGLPIARFFIERLNGRIWLESNPGSGATFYFTIPWKPVSLPEITVTGKKGKEKEVKLLIAEDEESNFFLIHEMLHGHGFDLLHAWNGLQAVDMVKNEDKIKLVLMDIKMPVMSGMEAMELIKKHRPELPVIALTAHALQGDKEKALEAGFDEYLSKPFSIQKLKDLIYQYLQKEKI